MLQLFCYLVQINYLTQYVVGLRPVPTRYSNALRALLYLYVVLNFLLDTTCCASPVARRKTRSLRSLVAVVGRALRARPPVKGTCNYLRTQSVL
jgi:hypothetical protein